MTDNIAGSMRVLVVDDNRDILESLSMVIELLGHEVELADNGEAALESLRTRPPHLALIDVSLPTMSGYEVARRARHATPTSSFTRLIAMTGWGRDEDRARALDAGFDAHVLKPLDLQRLRELLDVRQLAL